MLRPTRIAALASAAVMVVAAGHGGGIACEWPQGGTVTNCVIYDNTIGESWYSDGGGIYSWYGYGPPALAVTGNTVARNSAPRGAGFAYGGSTVTIDHTILAFNEGPATTDLGYSNVSFECVCVYANAGGDTLHGNETHCLNEDALFCGYLRG